MEEIFTFVMNNMIYRRFKDKLMLILFTPPLCRIKNNCESILNLMNKLTFHKVNNKFGV